MRAYGHGELAELEEELDERPRDGDRLARHHHELAEIADMTHEESEQRNYGDAFWGVDKEERDRRQGRNSRPLPPGTGMGGFRRFIYLARRVFRGFLDTCHIITYAGTYDGSCRNVREFNYQNPYFMIRPPQHWFVDDHARKAFYLHKLDVEALACCVGSRKPRPSRQHRRLLIATAGVRRLRTLDSFG